MTTARFVRIFVTLLFAPVYKRSERIRKWSRLTCAAFNAQLKKKEKTGEACLSRIENNNKTDFNNARACMCVCLCGNSSAPFEYACYWRCLCLSLVGEVCCCHCGALVACERGVRGTNLLLQYIYIYCISLSHRPHRLASAATRPSIHFVLLLMCDRDSWDAGGERDWDGPRWLTFLCFTFIFFFSVIVDVFCISPIVAYFFFQVDLTISA